MSNTRNAFAGMVLLVVSTAACASNANAGGGQSSGPEQSTPVPSGGGSVAEPQQEQLRATPGRVEVDRVWLRLSASAWVNRMPGPEPRAGGLYATIRVLPEGGAAVPDGLMIDRAWILYRDDLWQPAHLTPGRVIPGQLQVTVREGPAWPRGAWIDVIVRVRDSEGTPYMLRAPQIEVTAVH